jgi:hypothetical protein
MLWVFSIFLDLTCRTTLSTEVNWEKSCPNRVLTTDRIQKLLRNLELKILKDSKTQGE